MPRLGTADLVGNQVGDIIGRRAIGSPQHSKTAYRRDCVAIAMIVDLASRKGPGYKRTSVRESISNTDAVAARANRDPKVFACSTRTPRL